MAGIRATGQTDLGRLSMDLRAISDRAEMGSPATPESGAKSEFAKMLKEGVESVNQSIRQSDKLSTDIATGQSNNIHGAMLSATRAELGFNLLVQLRNKAIESYQEVMRMQV